ncbi:rhodanese-like domain-containing protein [Cryptosporangium phraense]|uniref:Rhodanese-like domain-containing protein n=1 Tax=Cryptosporangium phraense TaxID=2593070 RepID=A0A545AZR3_9ACTN|nr:rhodanese-like domain-containing protein [Cryptosporangium phraense]TQS46798.1 rhodanese-like domain-containing protein [Cryptosporangium phraense]
MPENRENHDNEEFAWRLTPAETVSAFVRGALLIDLRTPTERASQGLLPGAIVVDPSVLEWRLVPGSGGHLPEMTSYDVEIVLVSWDGSSSSVAAERLRELGLWRATDLAGGFEAWRAAEFPVGGDATAIRG